MAAPALDGSAVTISFNNGVGPFNMPAVTTMTDDILCLAVSTDASNLSQVTSLTDSNGLTWTQRSAASAQFAGLSNYWSSLELWFAHAPTIQSPGSVADQWQDVTGMTISTTTNTNDTATSTATSNAGAVLVNDGKTGAGSWYLEYEPTNPIDAGTQFGLTGIGGVIATTAQLYYENNGDIGSNFSGGGTASGVTWTSGQRSGLAFTLNGSGSGTFWFCPNVTQIGLSTAGYWNGSSTANPATNTGGLSMGSLSSSINSGGIFPYFYTQSSAAQACQVFTKLSQFSISAVPSGFNAYGTDTVNFGLTNSADGIVAALFAVNGCNLSAPWDPNGSLPATTTFGGSTTPSLTVSTTNINNFVIAAMGSIENNSAQFDAVPSGFTLLAGLGRNNSGFQNQMGIGYERPGAALSSQAIAWGSSSSDGCYIVDSLTAPGGGGSPAIPIDTRRNRTYLRR